MKITAWILSLGIIATGFVMAGGMGYYFDLLALMIVIMPTFLMLFAKHGTSIFKFFKLQTEQKSIIAKDGSKLSLCFGIIGLLIGAVSISAVHSSNPQNIGPALAVALLTPLYGMILMVFIFFPFREKGS
jgi:flagellar motor component MotA